MCFNFVNESSSRFLRSGMTQLRISAVLPLLMFSALSLDFGWTVEYVGCKTTCPPTVKPAPTQHSYSNSWFSTARGIIYQKHCLQESKTVLFSVMLLLFPIRHYHFTSAPYSSFILLCLKVHILCNWQRPATAHLAACTVTVRHFPVGS
jgi:hypothetical protein